MTAIGPVDLIFISHIHPDHHDPAFLRRYLAAHPKARLIIGPQQPPHLAHKMRIDGFKPEIAERLTIGGTELLIVPNEDDAGPQSEIDSALAVRRGTQSVVNLNDNPFVPRPARKRRQFLDLFAHYLKALDPKKAMPFAGKYYLGGPLARLNRYRGIPDAVEVQHEHGGRVVVLADGGNANYDLDTGAASAVRDAPYDLDAIDAYLSGFGIEGYDHEREICGEPQHALPILPLLASAKKRARVKVKMDEPYWLVLRPKSMAGRSC